MSPSIREVIAICLKIDVEFHWNFTTNLRLFYKPIDFLYSRAYTNIIYSAAKCNGADWKKCSIIIIKLFTDKFITRCGFSVKNRPIASQVAIFHRSSWFSDATPDIDVNIVSSVVHCELSSIHCWLRYPLWGQLYIARLSVHYEVSCQLWAQLSVHCKLSCPL